MPHRKTAMPALVRNTDGFPAPYAAASDEALARAWRAGDVDAGEALLRRYVPMVRAAAGVHAGTRFAPGVLVQAGMIGLVSTLFTFDPGDGPSFSTTAALAIAQQVQSAVDAEGPDQDG